MEGEPQKFKAKRRIRKSDLDAVRAVFEDLDRQGKLCPQELLKAAADPASVLHRYFEWDNAAAAEKYRLQQARWLLESIEVQVVLPSTQVVTVNYAMSVRGNEESQGERRYVLLSSKALRNEYTLRCIAEQAQRELRLWLDKYANYQALEAVRDAVSGAADALEKVTPS